MKRQLIIMCFIGFVQLTAAQNFTHDFGKFSNEEFLLQHYDKDPSAEAVVIYDIGRSYFTRNDDGLELIFERKMKIKILTKAGLKWAQISIPYYHENDKSEIISDLKGNTYNFENGQVRISVLDKNNAFTEKVSENINNKVFAMPDVKEGSVFEVSYMISSPYFFNFHNWEFQQKIPVIYSEYVTEMIPFYEYTYLFQGANKFDEFKTYEITSHTSPYGSIEYKDMVYEYVMKDLPAFKDESFITSINDYIIKLDFQLSALHRTDGYDQEIMTTWPKLSQDLIDNDSFGKYMNICKKKATELPVTMDLTSKTAIEKAKIIEHYVKSNFNWNGDKGIFATKNVKEFLTSKTGNCADINLFLAGMLNAAGIEAYPVLLSTRNHGKLKINYPFLHFFNYVIVTAKIDSSTILFDATEPLCCFNEIPSRCINGRGLIIKKKVEEWVNLKSTTVSSIGYDMDIRTNPGLDSLYQSCSQVTMGYEAIDSRNKFSTNYQKLKTDLLGINSLQGDTLKTVDLNNIEKPFEIDFNKIIPLQKIENNIIITPFCNLTLTENPLKFPTRNYPVDMIYRKAYKFQSTIAIPNGYALLTKPENLNISNNQVRIIFAANVQDIDTVKVVGVYEFKKDVYPAAEYLDLKYYFNKIVDKFNEKLVFVKKEQVVN